MVFVEILKNLLNNATLLFAVTLGYSYLAQRLTSYRYLRSIVPGLLFGISGVLNMLSPFVVMPGVFIDSRTIIIAISGTQGGFLSAVISASIISLFRLSIGGPGVVSALPGIWLNVVLGSLFYRYKQYRPLKDLNSVLVLQFHFVLGVISTILAIVPFVLLPVGIREPTFQAVSLPMMIIFPLTGMIAGYLLYQQRLYFEMVVTQSNERNMLRTLIDNIPDYIFIKDAQRRFILSNPAHTKAAQATSENDLLGKTAVAYFSPELTAQYESDDRRVLAGEFLLAQERQSVNEQGERIYVSTTKVPIHDTLGRVTGVIGISRDITAEKLRAEQTQQLDVERQRTRMLKAFIQNASHDFRTPLSIISTKSYLLWRDPNGADRDERITMINAQITRLSRLMDDTLGMIELNEGVIEYDFQAINLSRVIQTVAAEYAPRVQENRQTLNVSVPEAMVEIEADEQLLRWRSSTLSTMR